MTMMTFSRSSVQRSRSQKHFRRRHTSTRRGRVRRTVSSGENSWRRLCPAKDAPPDDDDDDDDDGGILIKSP